jgi:hypothetical protein
VFREKLCSADVLRAMRLMKYVVSIIQEPIARLSRSRGCVRYKAEKLICMVGRGWSPWRPSAISRLSDHEPGSL